MLICFKCGKEMICLKNGVGVRTMNNDVYPGDIFQCSRCGIKIIKTNTTSVYDPKEKIKSIPLIEFSDRLSMCANCTQPNISCEKKICWKTVYDERDVSLNKEVDYEEPTD